MSGGVFLANTNYCPWGMIEGQYIVSGGCLLVTITAFL